MDHLVFLKLGGSLITDKTRPRSVRKEKLNTLCKEIYAVLARDPNLLLLLGHGSGSFGHVAAKTHRTREGLPPTTEIKKYWSGFSEVWHEARALNVHVMNALRAAGIPSMALPASASVIADNGKIAAWDIEPIQRALLNGMMPVVFGDVVFDNTLGGTILSTEDLFMHLARELHPQRVLLAGLEDGIYADFPLRKQKVARVTPQSYEEIRESIGASAGTDVTGGMDSKTKQMLALVTEIEGLSVQIFSGKNEGTLVKVLRGEKIGTLIIAK